MTVPFFHITQLSLRCTKKALQGRSLGSKSYNGRSREPLWDGPSSKGRNVCLLERVRTEVRSETFEAKVLRTLIGTIKAPLGSRKHCPRPAGRSITLKS